MNPHRQHPTSRTTQIIWTTVACLVASVLPLAAADGAASDPPTPPTASANAASFWSDLGSWWDDDDETGETDGEPTDSESDWWGSDGTSDPTEEASDGEEEWEEELGDGDGDGVEPAEPDLTEPTGDAPLGYVCYRDGREKPIKPRDALWLAKMVHGETRGNPTQEDADAMLWTLISRTDMPSFRDHSVEYLTRRYSQPINRRWTRTGEKCRAYYADDFEGEIPRKCSEANTRRRARYIAMDWDDIDDLARRATLRFAAGQIANPVIGAIGWLDSGQWQTSENDGFNGNRKRLAVIERNTFYARRRGPATVDWNEWDVSVVPADEFCPDFVGNAGAEEVSQ